MSCCGTSSLQRLTGVRDRTGYRRGGLDQNRLAVKQQGCSVGLWLSDLNECPSLAQVKFTFQTEKDPEMPSATWNGVTIADAPADRVEIVEGNVYFPEDAVRREYLTASETHTVCAWKGTASYYDVTVNGEVNRDAAWYYPQPKDAAKNVTGRIAFWKGVKVE
jgi:uncharacterized protein (DUF427 family)